MTASDLKVVLKAILAVIHLQSTVLNSDSTPHSLGISYILPGAKRWVLTVSMVSNTSDLLARQ